MKLFDDFEAVRFPEENLIFITHGGYLYYIYDVEYKHWRKYRNAGNDHITLETMMMSAKKYSWMHWMERLRRKKRIS